jgi:hypothetical protein
MGQRQCRDKRELGTVGGSTGVTQKGSKELRATKFFIIIFAVNYVIAFLPLKIGTLLFVLLRHRI